MVALWTSHQLVFDVDIFPFFGGPAIRLEFQTKSLNNSILYFELWIKWVFNLINYSQNPKNNIRTMVVYSLEFLNAPLSSNVWWPQRLSQFGDGYCELLFCIFVQLHISFIVKWLFIDVAKWDTPISMGLPLMLIWVFEYGV